jgi:hypothetical protein
VEKISGWVHNVARVICHYRHFKEIWCRRAQSSSSFSNILQQVGVTGLLLEDHGEGVQ